MTDALTTTRTQRDFATDYPESPAAYCASDLALTEPAQGLTASLVRMGKVMLDSTLLRQLRQSRLLSQQDLADECWRRSIRVSIATIKRAELGHAVRFRIARELARCFDLPVTHIVDMGESVAGKRR